MKKKILVSTLAASLAFGTFAAGPLAPIGNSGHVAYATSAVPSTTADLKTRLDAIVEALTDAEEVKVESARTALSELMDSSLISDVWTPIIQAISVSANPSQYSDLTIDNLFNLFKKFGLIAYGDSSQTASDTDKAVIRQLGKLGEVDNLSYSDAVDFMTSVEDQIMDNPFALLGTEENVRAYIKDILVDTINDTSLQLSEAFANVGVTSTHLLTAKDNITTAIDSNQLNTHKEAIKALLIAAARTELTYSDTPSNSGRTKTPKLVFHTIEIPSSLITWSKVDGSNITVVDGKFTLSSSVSSGTATFTATVNLPGSLVHELLLKDEFDVTMTYTGSTTTTPPPATEDKNEEEEEEEGEGEDESATPSIEDTIKDAQKDLNDLKEQLQNADPGKKDELVKEAKKKVEEAAKTIAKVDVSKTVEVTDNKATTKLDTKSIIDQMKVIKEETKKLNDSLKEVDEKSKDVKPLLNLDLGKVDAKNVEVPLSKDILNEAKNQEIDQVQVTVNNVSVGFPADEFEEDTTLTIQKQTKEEAGDTSIKPTASDYYNFEFTSNGDEITEFKKPVTLKLPVADTSDYDTDLLTLAKIINGKLEYYGGKYNNDTSSFSAKRNSFSTYVVVENKVEFDDTANLTWAKRYIDVVAAKGIINGRGNNQYVPGDNVTRAEFATMLVKTFGLGNADTTESFTDVNDGDWFQAYVAAAVSNGLINGRTSEIFDPNADITRAEMAVMTARALKALRDRTDVGDVNAELAKFNDAAGVKAVYQDGVALVVSEGIIQGDDKGNFLPSKSTTRAEAAAVIYRVLNAE